MSVANPPRGFFGHHGNRDYYNFKINNDLWIVSLDILYIIVSILQRVYTFIVLGKFRHRIPSCTNCQTVLKCSGLRGFWYTYILGVFSPREKDDLKFNTTYCTKYQNISGTRLVLLALVQDIVVFIVIINCSWKK